MILKKIKLTNFGIFKNKEISDLQKLITITGNNGAGKTTILRALELAFGSKDRKYEDYLSLYSSEEFYKIELEGMYNSKEIQIQLIYQNGNVKRLLNYDNRSYHNQDALLYLQNKFNSQVFNKFNFGTSSLNVTELTPTELRNHIEILMDLNYKEKIEELKNIRIQNNEEFTRMETTIQVLSSRKFEKVNCTKPLFDEERIKSEEEKIQSKKNLLKEISRKKKIQQEITYLDLEIMNLKEKVGFFSDQLLTESQKEQIHNDEIILEGELTRLNSLLREALAEKGKLVAQQESLSENQSRHQKEKNELRNLIECPTCYQKVDLNHREFLNHFYDTQLTSLKDQLRTNNIAYSKILGKIENIEKDIAKTERTKNANNQLLQNDIKNLSEKESASLLLNRLELEKKSLLEDLILLDEIDTSLTEQQVEYSIEKMVHELNVHKSNWQTYQLNLIKFEEIEKEKREIEKEIEDKKQRIQELRKNLEINDILIIILSKKLPTKIVSNFLIQITHRMNYFINNVYHTPLQVMFTETNQGITLDYRRDEGRFMSASNASGFEKQLINLIFRLVSASFSKLGIVCLDEPDSNASDENSEFLFENLLKFVEKESNLEQVFYITHRTGVMEKINSFEQSTLIKL